MREIDLPSGRKMEVIPAPFTESKKLYQAVAAELLRLQIRGSDEQWELVKNMLCLVIASPSVEAALAPCLKRCTYQGQKFKEDTFEPVEAREDYLDFCYEVAKENVAPFTKSLFAQFKGMLSALQAIQSSSASRTNTV